MNQRLTQVAPQPVQDIPQPELEAGEKITTHLLQKMQESGEDGEERVAGIEQDEHDLFHAITAALNIPEQVKNEAIRRQVAWNNDETREAELAVLPPDTQLRNGRLLGLNPEYSRIRREWTSMLNLAGAIANAEVNPQERIAGQYTKEELAASNYLRTLESRAMDRHHKATGQTGLVEISHEGLELGEVYGLLRILEDGDLGFLFGFPTDDAHTLQGNQHPVETRLPLLAKFKREGYTAQNRGTVVVRSVDCPLSTGLYSMLVSRAFYATQDKVRKILDSKAQREHDFARKYFQAILGNVVAPLPGDQDHLEVFRKEYGLSQEQGWDSVPKNILARYRLQREQELADKVLAIDKKVNEHVMGVIEDPKGYINPVAGQLREMQRLVRLEPVYRQIMADGEFSDNERAMMQAALPAIGIRHPETIDWFLDISRDPDTNQAVMQSPENMRTFYDSTLYRFLKKKME